VPSSIAKVATAKMKQLRLSIDVDHGKQDLAKLRPWRLKPLLDKQSVPTHTDKWPLVHEGGLRLTSGEFIRCASCRRSVYLPCRDDGFFPAFSFVTGKGLP
jgi:hypothetical protein